MINKEDIAQSLIEQGFKQPTKRNFAAGTPMELEVEDGNVKIYTPNAPQLIEPAMADLGFKPGISDLEEAAQMPRVAYPGQINGEYVIAQVHWQPETTSRRGVFDPQRGIELNHDTNYDAYWLAGKPVGSKSNQ